MCLLWELNDLRWGRNPQIILNTTPSFSDDLEYLIKMLLGTMVYFIVGFFIILLILPFNMRLMLISSLSTWQKLGSSSVLGFNAVKRSVYSFSPCLLSPYDFPRTVLGSREVSQTGQVRWRQQSND